MWCYKCNINFLFCQQNYPCFSLLELQNGIFLTLMLKVITNIITQHEIQKTGAILFSATIPKTEVQPNLRLFFIFSTILCKQGDGFLRRPFLCLLLVLAVGLGGAPTGAVFMLRFSFFLTSSSPKRRLGDRIRLLQRDLLYLPQLWLPQSCDPQPWLPQVCSPSPCSWS